MRSLVVGAIIVLLSLVCCAPDAEPPEPFTVVWSFDTSGQIEPCGCSAHQFGGLARRATVIDELRADGPVLAIEGAHILEEENGFQLFKGETIVSILTMMDYNAMMLGSREVQHGRSGIEALTPEAYPFQTTDRAQASRNGRRNRGQPGAEHQRAATRSDRSHAGLDGQTQQHQVARRIGCQSAGLPLTCSVTSAKSLSRSGLKRWRSKPSLS